MVHDAKQQLRFTTAPSRPLKRTKNLPKAQAGQIRAAVRHDPVLGYRIEQVDHPTLWGSDRHWQAVSQTGR